MLAGPHLAHLSSSFSPGFSTCSSSFSSVIVVIMTTMMMMMIIIMYLMVLPFAVLSPTTRLCLLLYFHLPFPPVFHSPPPRVPSFFLFRYTYIVGLAKEFVFLSRCDEL